MLGALSLIAALAVPELPALKDLAAKAGIEFGANLPYLVDGAPPNNWESSPIIAIEKRLAKQHFSILSAGWQTYPGHSWPAAGQTNLAGAKRFAEWCRQEGIRVHFHGLAYSSRVPWLIKHPVASSADRARLRAAHDAGVSDTVREMAGLVDLYDVCNEQLQPAYVFLGYRTQDSFWRAYQEEGAPELAWHTQAFRLARKADPRAKLILLDFNNEVESPKADQYFALASRLKELGVPLDGVGFQVHLSTQLNRDKGHGHRDDAAYWQSFERNLRRFSALGLDLWITELDVSIDPAKPLEEELRRQAEIYGRVVLTARSIPGMKGIKVWGVIDRDPWGKTDPRRPNLFDGDGSPKPAYHAVVEALQPRAR